MDLQLTGKRALVTGSTSGLGEEIARTLAKEGATVIVHGRDEARANAVAKEIGGTIALGDLSTDAGADAVAEAAGEIDILVNNLGVFDASLTWDNVSADDWNAIYNVNVTTGVRMIKKFVPGMKSRGWGRVIQISSVLGAQPMDTQPHYAATNAARDNLAASLARELKDSGVTSNAVAAGGILTPSSKAHLVKVGQQAGWGETWEDMAETAQRRLTSMVDVGRIGLPNEYADMVTFLASPRSSYVMGTTLRVDGGWH
ncbi:SDR family NAD(P)-dependent oxidoreductase [Herbidospora mongoliensis]|uniref:SDR family NAD(P)-dependent oxidoreductase n=1 Tax=Herbidospora mongoliensis TaxID=688067 RepID=UPI000837780B|nr:SDR family NAD(P)-dependent oxidoreductase [Herbidospora mongoliensis]